MADPVRYSDTLTFRIQPEVSELLSHAARARGSKPSEYARQALLTGLRLDGFDIGTLPTQSVA